MTYKPGPKELAVRALREANAAAKPRRSIADLEAAAAKAAQRVDQKAAAKAARRNKRLRR